MIANDKVKQFDCIKMKSNIQKQVYEETKNMSIKELLRYFNGSHPTGHTVKTPTGAEA